MRIISDFHDYYDCCQDPSDKVNVYIRKPEKITLKGDWGGFYDNGWSWKARQDEPHVDFQYIGFCGSIYPVVQLIKNEEAPEVVFELSRLKEIYDEYTTMRKSRHDPDYNNILRAINRWKSFLATRIVNYSIHRQKSDKGLFTADLLKLFVEHHTPIFSIRELQTPGYGRNNTELALNCRLADYKFARLFPPHLAAQEIEMYLFGVLGTQQREKIPAVSNSDLIEAKGFDLKTSFRKAKST